MQKWKTSSSLTVVFSLLAVTGLAQTAHEFEAPQVNRIAREDEVFVRLQDGYGVPDAALSVSCVPPAKIEDHRHASRGQVRHARSWISSSGKRQGLLVVPPGVMGVVGPYARLGAGTRLCDLHDPPFPRARKQPHRSGRRSTPPRSSASRRIWRSSTDDPDRSRHPGRGRHDVCSLFRFAPRIFRRPSLCRPPASGGSQGERFTRTCATCSSNIEWVNFPTQIINKPS